ncbi:unnamed protein product, partial [Heterotrigona itama]
NNVRATMKKLNEPKRGEFNIDLWKQKTTKDIDTNWMSSDTVRHTLTHFGVKKKRIPASLRKRPSNIPAVESPHPGISYNPSFQDHQNLLCEVVRKEKEFIKEEEHLKRVTTKMFKKVSPEERENNLIKEMSEGLKPENDQDPGENEDDDPTIKSVYTPLKNQKKTRVQRRKQKEQKALVYKRQQEKIEKKKISDIYKLKLLDRQLAAKEKKQKVSRQKRLKKKALKALGTKILSKIKFEPLEPDFKLSTELTGNLRNTEPTNNLLKDRFKSFQKRNIIAPTNVR